MPKLVYGSFPAISVAGRAPSHVPLGAWLVCRLRFELGFIGRIYGHSGSHQARRKKTGKALGDSTNRELTGVKKRVLSATARAKMAKAARKRWAKFRAEKSKA